MNKHTASHVPMIAFLTASPLGPRARFDKEGTAADPFVALRTEYSKVHAEAEAVIDAAAKDNRGLTDEEKTANEARFAKLTSLKATMEEKQKFAALALQGDPGAPTGATVTTGKDIPGRDEFNASEGRGNIRVGEARDIDRQAFAQAVRQWVNTGAVDRKFATITTATASSILLPKKVITPIVTGAMNAFREGFAAYGIMPMETIGDTSTINIPVLDPTAGGLVAENAGSETENAPTLAESMVSTVKTYQSGSAYFSNLSLSAPGFDLLAATVPNLQYNKELGLEAAIAAAIIADSGITQIVTTATTAGFTYANSVSLANKLPKRYQVLKVRLLGQEAFQAAEGLLDENNRPVMVTDSQNQTLRKMHGTPTFRCDNFENFGASKVIGAEYSLVGFHLRDCGEGLARYTQVPAKPDQSGVNLFGYHAYAWAVSAVSLLKTPAS